MSRRSKRNKSSKGGIAEAAKALNETFMEGIRLHRTGRLADAAARYEAVLKVRPREPEALHMLGLAAYQSGNNAVAAELIGRAIGIKGGDPAYHNNLGTVLLALGRPAEAASAFRRAIDLNPAYAMAYNNLGNALQLQGQPEESVGCYRQALDLQPEFAEAFYNLGRAQHVLGDLRAAAASHTAALRINPCHVKAHYDLAGVQANMGRLEDSRASYDAALALAPDDAEILVARADLRERIGDLEGALADAEAAHRLAPGNCRAAVLAARCERRMGRLEAARRRLLAQDVAGADAESRAIVAYELAAIHDQEGDREQAFRRFGEGNRWMLQTPAGRTIDRAAFPDGVRRLCEWFTADWVASWTPISPATSNPAFLVGFPRSGTTLLGQILDAHPRIVTLEEQLTIDRVKQVILKGPGGFPDGLAALTDPEVADLRRLYETEIGRYLPDRDHDLVVDKMPLNLVDLGLIQRIFPGAHILLMLRHPCDAVLSGFMQAFELNDSMVQFASLDDTARLYAEVMRLWFRYEEVLPLSVLKVRYEDLVADFEGEARRILAFLEMPWDDAVRAFYEHAKTRRIATPSYHQVTQPIYRRSMGRWRHYRAQLEPVLPILAPFVEAFGYSLDPAPSEPSGEAADAGEAARPAAGETGGRD